MQFDNGYTLTLPPSAVQSYDASIPGPVLGNGKIVVLPHVKTIDTVQSMIGGDFPVKNGQYVGNLSPGFHFNRVEFFEMASQTTTTELIQASLNMQSGIYTSTYQVLDTTTVRADIECDLYVMRQFPYCVMQTFRVTIPEAFQEGAAVYHHVYAPTAHINNPTFNNVLIHSDSVASGAALQVLSASGILADPGAPLNSTSSAANQSQRVLAMASVFLTESSADCEFEMQGTNNFRFDPYRCYTKLRLVSKGAVGPKTFRFHILTAMMSDADFPNPVEETKRIVINLKNKATTPAAVAARLRAEHVSAWSSMWTSNIHIEPKTGISANEATRIQKHVQSIRYALYSMYSCTREGINVDINPMNLTISDTTGTSMTDGDLWIVPMLILLKTDVARAMIEYKHKTIATATQLAASYGYKGVKYPYHTDIMGYQSALYWDAVSPLYVFNTCVVAMNAWNYYRVTKDREWMYAKGYTILKQCADFIVSLAELADPTNPDPLLASQYTFKRIAGLSGVEGDDNAFTVYTAKNALRYALEASYDLQYPPRDIWMVVYQNIKIPFFEDALNDVVQLHKTFPAVSTAETPRPPIMEVLVMLLPYYHAILFGLDTRLTASTIYKNLDFYKHLVPAEFINHPVNLLLEASMLAQLSQTDQVYVDTFYSKLDDFLTQCTDGVWGNFLGFGRSVTDQVTTPTSNDIVIVGMYILMYLQSLGGLKIAGGVTETRFLYEEMRIRTNRAGILPRTWRQLRIDGIGASQLTSVVTNKLVYTAT
jgi:Glycosyl hydrolase family 65 central catalytic domain